jgi:hypothetical protein
MAFLFLAGALALAACVPALAQPHYPPTLVNERNQAPLDSATKQIVVCIHGWNRDGSPDAYAPGSDWGTLVSSLNWQLSGTDWQLLLYHWEQDANTGFLDFDPLNGALMQDAIRNATTAADRADSWHGAHFAEQLNGVAPNLRQVHLIAHSAGSWLARKAATRLLELNPFVTVQTTLLDPFIPGSIGWPWTPTTSLGMAAMNSLASDTHQDRIYRLENYWTEDLGTVGTDNPSFAWRGAIDILGRKVNWDLALAYRYEGHSGPLLFYADTINSSLPGAVVPHELLWAPFQFSDYGWFKSMFYQAPFLPRITVQPHGPVAPVSDGTTVTLSVTATSSQSLSYQWFFGGSPSQVPSVPVTPLLRLSKPPSLTMSSR